MVLIISLLTSGLLSHYKSILAHWNAIKEPIKQRRSLKGPRLMGGPGLPGHRPVTLPEHRHWLHQPCCSHCQLTPPLPPGTLRATPLSAWHSRPLQDSSPPRPRLGDLCLFPGASTVSTTTHTGPTISDKSLHAQLNATSMPGSCQTLLSNLPTSGLCPGTFLPDSPTLGPGRTRGCMAGTGLPLLGFTPGLINGGVGSSKADPGSLSHQLQASSGAEAPPKNPLGTLAPSHQGPREAPRTGWPHKDQPQQQVTGASV